ncbi:hypothetical protein ASPZODRAFT_130110, partial [Penicilliopsis zonata CBS 506.65]
MDSGQWTVDTAYFFFSVAYAPTACSVLLRSLPSGVLRGVSDCPWSLRIIAAVCRPSDPDRICLILGTVP